jgi:hypothetical protein
MQQNNNNQQVGGNNVPPNLILKDPMKKKFKLLDKNFRVYQLIMYKGNNSIIF